MTPLCNSNRSSKPAPRALRSKSLKEICNISSALTAKRERESVTHISERHRNAMPRKSHVLQNWASEKNAVQMSLRLALHCFHPDDIKKVKMVTSPCRQDPFQKFLRNLDGTFVFDNCQQFGLSSSEHELMKYVAHAPKTIRLPPYNRRQTGCTSIDSYFLCPYDTVRVAHARDWSAFTLAACADMLEGFNRMNRRKCTKA